MVMLPMIASLVIVFIGDNVARAFGAVGAMSIVRFRTSVKDVRDTAFVFFSLAAGMGTGTDNLFIGIAGTLLVGFLIWILHITKHGNNRQQEYLLKFKVIAVESEHRKLYLPIFKKFLRSNSLININPGQGGEVLEMSFNVVFKKLSQMESFISELSTLDSLEQISLVAKEAGKKARILNSEVTN